jgi:DNA-binding transcriptional regulator YhcF (GntR family)
MNSATEPEVVLDGGAPVQEQIERQVRRLILQGILRPGEELPTVRALAVGLTTTPHAVEQAYRRLQQNGYLVQEVQGGSWTAWLPGARDDGNLEDLCREFLRRTTAHGYAPAEVLRTLHLYLEEG